MFSNISLHYLWEILRRIIIRCLLQSYFKCAFFKLQFFRNEVPSFNGAMPGVGMSQTTILALIFNIDYVRQGNAYL